jgi:hypothetical protein
LPTSSQGIEEELTTSPNSVAKVIIVRVREYESDARFCFEPGMNTADRAKLVKSGWLAALVQRSKVTEVEASDAVVEMAQREWNSYDDPVVPLRLRFPGNKAGIKTEPNVNILRTRLCGFIKNTWF